MPYTDDIFTNEGLETKDLKEADIDKQTLLDIINDYGVFVKSLIAQASYFSDILHMCPDVNSVKWRTKDPIHLLKKIVRKRKEAIKDNKVDSSKYMRINVYNYKDIVNDLIGLRAIYLFKTQWKPIDTYIFENFKVCSDEAIKIYHAEDDNIKHYPNCKENAQIEFKGKVYTYKLERKESRYRSTHYIIEGIPPNNYKFELQIRTILDEAWGEIDHHIRYPLHENNPELIRQMSILNGALSSCEEHVTNFNEYYLSLEVKDSSTVVIPEAQHINLNENQETDEKSGTGNSADELINEKVDISSNVPNSTITAVKNPSRLSEIARLGVDPFTEMTRQSAKAQMGSLAETLEKAKIGLVAETLRQAQESNEVQKLLKEMTVNQNFKNSLLNSLSDRDKLIRESVKPIAESLKPPSTDLLKGLEVSATQFDTIGHSLKPVIQESDKITGSLNTDNYKHIKTKK